MSDDGPINCRWSGEAFEPVSDFWSKRADRQFVVGVKYMIEARQERSEASHKAFFAAIKEAWMNLPEDKAAQFPTPEHLRKWALIECGYRNTRMIACATSAEASRMAAFMQPMDEFAIIHAVEDVLQVHTAQSQSYQAMGKRDFQESKTAVLEYLANLLGVSVDDLKKAEAA